jgi:DNA polymerase
MVNPNDCLGGIYDCDQINAWAKWQNSMQATIMLFGKDWGDEVNFKNKNGNDDGRYPTNRNVQLLFSNIGYEIDVPTGNSYGRHHPDLFFTNLVLCLREKKGMQGALPKKTLNNCAHEFGKDLIELIKPKVVIALGMEVATAIVKAFDDEMSFPKRMRDAINISEGFSLNKDTVLFPVYHCGAWGTNRNRSKDDQKNDWIKIKNYLDKIKKAPVNEAFKLAHGE